MDINITDLKIIMLALWGLIIIYGVIEIKFTSKDFRYLLAVLWIPLYLTLTIMDTIQMKENQNQEKESPTCQK